MIPPNTITNKTYGQYVVKTVVTNETVVLTITSPNVASVLEAVGIIFFVIYFYFKRDLFNEKYNNNLLSQ